MAIIGRPSAGSATPANRRQAGSPAAGDGGATSGAGARTAGSDDDDAAGWTGVSLGSGTAAVSTGGGAEIRGDAGCSGVATEALR
ncbi:hypothetical protein GCM10017083_16420 [Thalassobaculum fulvum]|uniref:Uncharacterized protein n=1 Tax=Thalassobaculum fulvum TaxID=1633335 RepID=A0A918XQ92_9PROT|nr:hypothetical protein GCM10017083_16420 [Thalassobaculum fulvum]